MTIRAYHHSRVTKKEQFALFQLQHTEQIQPQLHGWRMTIIVTKTMENGNIDVEDVREKGYNIKMNYHV
jgi:glycine dehydrogenase